jgi:hypothetical protein
MVGKALACPRRDNRPDGAPKLAQTWENPLNGVSRTVGARRVIQETFLITLFMDDFKNFFYLNQKI